MDPKTQQDAVLDPQRGGVAIRVTYRLRKTNWRGA